MSSFTDQGRNMFNKIYESHLKRQKRLHHSKSDSKLPETERQFRFRRIHSDSYKRKTKEFKSTELQGLGNGLTF